MQATASARPLAAALSQLQRRQPAAAGTAAPPRGTVLEAKRHLRMCSSSPSQFAGQGIYSGSSSLRGAHVPAKQLSRQQGGRRQVAVQARRGGGGVDVADRVVASIPFIVPLLDGLRYGKFFLLQFPTFATVLVPLEPLIRLYFSFPLAGLIAFFGIYLGIINNPNFSRYVRYHAMQAVLLDIILIFPGLLESIFRPPMGGPGLQVYITLYNTIFLFLFACVAYGVGSCMVGQTARLPLVGDAADAQVR